jgi:D-lactate dehydrogenase (cytochrome)
MDWLDLFIGSDGTLGIFTKIVLRLLPCPADFVSGILFFAEERSCWELIPKIKSFKGLKIAPCSLEYFDHNALQRLKSKHTNIPGHSRAALFFEQDVSELKDYDLVMENWYEFLSAENIMLDDSWFAQGPKDIQTSGMMFRYSSMRRTVRPTGLRWARIWLYRIIISCQ